MHVMINTKISDFGNILYGKTFIECLVTTVTDAHKGY
jgi:hypothetical protein